MLGHVAQGHIISNYGNTKSRHFENTEERAIPCQTKLKKTLQRHVAFKLGLDILGVRGKCI